MNWSIIQGRLSVPVDGKIQEFPFENWEYEFEKLSVVNLNQIEFIITKKSFDYFLDLDISKYSKNISALCCDHLIDKNFHNFNFLEENLVPICEISRRFNIENINIPLLEDSQVSENNIIPFSTNILKISEKYPELNFNFEIESQLEYISKIINLSEKFYSIYDTGNMNYLGINHYDYITKIINKISNVHLKDRDKNGSHQPGKGTTDFKTIFSTLKKYNYNKTFTIQTQRGEYGRELETISNHSDYFKTLWSNTI